MRFFLKKLLLSSLTSVSCAIVKKYDPKIIAITGSYGKTSAREAIFAVLNNELGENIRQTEGELNGEWGLCISIIGSRDPHGSMIYWLGILFKGIVLMVVKKSYPDILLLEMAAERPGDIEYLVRIARPHIAVMTGIGPTHLEFFGSTQEVAKEKFKLITSMRKGGTAIYNADDDFLKSFMQTVNTKTLSFAIHEEADVTASQIRLELNDLPEEAFTADSSDHLGGIGFRITHKSTDRQAYIADVVGRSHIYAALAAVGIASVLSIDQDRAVEALKHYKPALGRMRLIKGIKHTIVIDDSYNSSPDAVELALETQASLAVKGNKWAVLGEMLELGVSCEASHRAVGRRVAELGTHYLITVGTPAHFIAHGARQQGMSQDRIFEFDNKEKAGRFLQDRMKKGDLILIKASRGVHQETHGTRFEKIVKEVMAEPQKADELLVHNY